MSLIPAKAWSPGISGKLEMARFAVPVRTAFLLTALLLSVGWARLAAAEETKATAVVVVPVDILSLPEKPFFVRHIVVQLLKQLHYSMSDGGMLQQDAVEQYRS